MKYKASTFLLLLVFILINCSDDSIGLDVEHEKEFFISQINEHKPGWVRVKFKELEEDLNTLISPLGVVNTNIDELDKVANALGATKISRVFNEGGKFRKRREKYGLHLWYDFYVGEEEPITRSVAGFSDLSIVDLVELIPVEREAVDSKDFLKGFMGNYTASLFSANYTNATRTTSGDGFKFNDPLLHRQWHYYNDGSTDSSIAGADANVFPAWKVTTGDPSVIVAVVDGGIDFNHPDLAQNMWINTNEIAGNGLDDDNNGYIDDIHGFRWGREGVGEPTGEIFPMDHGSHCAGTIAAVNNNGVGLAGVAGGNGNQNSGIRLMSCQTYIPNPEHPNDPHGKSTSTSQTPDAFAYAADNGAVIANCSFGYGGTSLSAAYKAGIDYFVDNAGVDENGVQTGPMKGGLMVASAGNDGELKDNYPASYERVVSVAYSMSNYLKSKSSNYGPSIDVTAPGGATSSSYAPNRVGGVFSTAPMESMNFDVEPGYSYKSGTSMSAPHVSGIAALILSAAVENDIPMTVEKLRNIVERSCWSLDKYNQNYKGMLGHGQVDAGFAIQILLGGDNQPVSQPANINVTLDKNSVKVEWGVPADFFENPIASTEVYISMSSLQGVDFDDLPTGVKKEVIENTKEAGEIEEKTYLDLSSETEYHIALIAIDRQKQKSEPVLITAKTTSDSSVAGDGTAFKLYPNPVKENLFVGFPESSYGKKVEIELLNALGYSVYKNERIGESSPFKINVEKLTTGAYTVYIKCIDKEEKHTIIKH